MKASDCPPGSHSHAYRPNWQPAETADESLSNVREGLEELSERRLVKLFELLMADGCRSSKALVAADQEITGGGKAADVEHYPDCGEVVRVRGRWSASTAKIVNEWLRELKRTLKDEKP